MKNKGKNYRTYIITDDRYGWYWIGYRWSVVRSIASVYTKKSLPESIRELKLVKKDKADVTTWKYVSEKFGKTASVKRLRDEL
jgi:hypothetical protein